MVPIQVAMACDPKGECPCSRLDINCRVDFRRMLWHDGTAFPDEFALQHTFALSLLSNVVLISIAYSLFTPSFRFRRCSLHRYLFLQGFSHIEIRGSLPFRGPRSLWSEPLLRAPLAKDQAGFLVGGVLL